MARDLPFACVPFGTRNHFARDIGLDRADPVAALDALVDGQERRIDVGRAGQRLFLNNVSNNAYRLEVLSIGERERLDEGCLHLYAPTGMLRTGWEERRGAHFTVDALPGRLHAAVDGEPEELRTPIEFRVEPLALRVLVPRSPGA